MIDYPSLFPEIKPSAKAWAYVANRPLSAQEETSLAETVNSFRAQWSSHGRLVHSAFAVLENQILILSADVQQGDISGCGIDKSLHLLNEIANNDGYEWASSLSIAFKDGNDRLRVVPRSEFKSLVKEGQVDQNTIVFDLSISHLQDIRSGLFELPAGASWHQRVFRLPALQPLSNF